MEQPCRLKPAGHFYTSAIYFPIFPLSLFPSHNMFFKKGKYTIPRKADVSKQDIFKTEHRFAAVVIPAVMGISAAAVCMRAITAEFGSL